MPIYAYRCAACGHARDVLQKMSDDPLTVCPVCGESQFQKQVTAAGFQLKGSGWYVTDFRNGGGSGGGAAAPAASPAAAPASAPDTAGGGSSGGETSASAGGGTACGGSCACH